MNTKNARTTAMISVHQTMLLVRLGDSASTVSTGGPYPRGAYATSGVDTGAGSGS
jgi:hypothetical protein